jgi:RNA polymerase sigma-70 factor (ECF subfamily)
MVTPPDNANDAAHDESDLQPVIARARMGDVAAFNTLVERFQRAAYTVALRMVSNPEVAADITQDAVLAAFKGMVRFRGGSFRVWLLRIVTNQCLDYWRAQKRRPSVSLDMLVAPESDEPGADSARGDAALVDHAWDPATLAEQRELHELLQRALLTLPDDQRVTVILSDVEGLSYEDIAAVTQTQVGTVKSRLARARARLRDYLRHHAELLPRAYRHQFRADQPPPTPGSTPRSTR